MLILAYEKCGVAKMIAPVLTNFRMPAVANWQFLPLTTPFFTQSSEQMCVSMCIFQDSTTPLILAAAGGHVSCALELLQQGADTNARRNVRSHDVKVINSRLFRSLISLFVKYYSCIYCVGWFSIKTH